METVTKILMTHCALAATISCKHLASCQYHSFDFLTSNRFKNKYIVIVQTLLKVNKKLRQMFYSLNCSNRNFFFDKFVKVYFTTFYSASSKPCNRIQYGRMHECENFERLTKLQIYFALYYSNKVTMCNAALMILCRRMRDFCIYNFLLP